MFPWINFVHCGNHSLNFILKEIDSVVAIVYGICESMVCNIQHPATIADALTLFPNVPFFWKSYQKDKYNGQAFVMRR